MKFCYNRVQVSIATAFEGKTDLHFTLYFLTREYYHITKNNYTFNTVSLLEYKELF